MKSTIILFLLLTTLSFAFQNEKFQTAPLTKSTTIVFADSLLAVKIVTTEDDFTKVISKYDKAASLQSTNPISKKEYIKHHANNVMPWPKSEIERFNSIVKTVRHKIEYFKLTLPKEIILIRTTANENGGVNVAYTRQNAIMFTVPMLKSTDSTLINVLLHEIAHVYSRHNLKKRNDLYQIFGFRQSNEIVLPANWDDRRISNPDAPALNTIIDIKYHKKTLILTPLLYARTPIYDTTKGGGIFQSLSFEMMQVERKEGQWQPILIDGNPVLFNPSPKTLPDFWNQIGKNTHYIIHPEEIMASNFVMMVNKKPNVPNPEIIQKMKEIILQK